MKTIEKVLDEKTKNLTTGEKTIYLRGFIAGIEYQGKSDKEIEDRFYKKYKNIFRKGKSS